MSSPVDYPAFHARLHPDRLALVEMESGRRWSYADLDTDIGRCAALMKEMKIGVGDRVASLSRNRALLIILHHACARLGAIYVPLNWRLSPIELSALLDEAGPVLLIGDDMLGKAGLSGVGHDDFMAEMTPIAPMKATAINPDIPSLILFTSGTSGKPKGALLTERNLSETAINFSLLGHVTAQSRFLCDAPMFHIIGLVTNCRPALMAGGTVCISPGFDAATTLARLSDSDLAITHYFGVPQMATALRARPELDPAKLSLTALFTGGAPHASAAIRSWLDIGVPVVDGYGMSEAGTVFGMPLKTEIIRDKAGSVGISTPRIESRIVDEDERPCEAGATGELMIRGDNVISAYWQLSRDQSGDFTRDGWFRTGDIFIRDTEGFYWLIDRKKDMFISGGENIYPAEIENILAEHQAISECALIGCSDRQWGEVGHLFVVRRPGHSLDEAGLLGWLEARTARYKLPKLVSFLDGLPRNGAGKVQKLQLKKNHGKQS